MTRDIGYAVDVSIAPDRREEVEKERIAEAIADDEARKCGLCGELIYRDHKGFEGELCSDCAELLVDDVEAILRRLADATEKGKELKVKLKSGYTNRHFFAACVDIVADFLSERFTLDGSVAPVGYQGATVDIRDLLLDYLQEEE